MTSTSESLRLDLPPPGLATYVLALLFGGAFFFGMGAVFTWTFLTHAAKRDLHVVIIFVFILFIPVMLCGLGLIIAGIAGALRRTTIIADAAHIAVTHSVLGIKRHLSFHTASLVDLTLSKNVGSSDAITWARIYACFADGRRKTFLTRHGGKEMTRLADALRAMLWPQRSTGDDADPPPAGFLKIITRTPELAIHMHSQPPGQIAGGSYYLGWILAIGMPIFSILLIILLMVIGIDSSSFVIFCAMLPLVDIIFIAIGGAIATWAARIAKRQADILLTPQFLRIDITGPGDPAHHEWNREQIASLTAGPGDLSVNNQTVQQLNIRDRSGRTVSLFAGRNLDDLVWLGQTLQRAIGLPDVAVTRAAILQSLTAAAPETMRNPVHSDLIDGIDGRLRNTNIVRIPDSEKLIFHINPLRSRGATAGPIIGVCFFILFSLLPLAALILPQPNGKRMPILIPLTLLFAALIPLALIFLYIRRINRATAVIELTPKEISVEYDNPLKKNRIRINCDQITAVKAGWQTQGESQSLVLQFFLLDGSHRAALEPFRRKELELIAGVLQLAMGFSAAGG